MEKINGAKSLERFISKTICVDILQEGEGFYLVSYEHNGKRFQGVLLDIYRSGVPCGIRPPDWFASVGGGERCEPGSGPYHTISTRMTYFQSDGDTLLVTPAPPGVRGGRGSRARRRAAAVLGVRRLRPRQVLCTQCQNFCNDKLQTVTPTTTFQNPAAPQTAAAKSYPPARHEQVPTPQVVPRVPVVRLNERQLLDSSRSAIPSRPPPAVRPSLIDKPLTVSPIRIVGSNVARVCAAPVTRRRQLITASSAALVSKKQLVEPSGNGVSEQQTDSRPPPDITDGRTVKSPQPSVSAKPPSDPVESAKPPESSAPERRQRVAISSAGSAQQPTVRRKHLTKLLPSLVPIAAEHRRRADAVQLQPEQQPPLAKIKISGGAIVRSDDQQGGDGSGRRLGLRKRRLAAGSMEDLWDESVLDDGADVHTAGSASPPDTLTPVLKISFGAGSVLEIPARCTTGGAAAGVVSASGGGPTASTKAARRALRRARLDVQQRRQLSGTSPARSWGGRSPGYPQASPAHYRVSMGAAAASPMHHNSQLLLIKKKRHKHKLKRKRRHRQRDNAVDVGSPLASPQGSVEQFAGPTHARAMRQRCLSQKLSISLRRIRASEYTSHVPDVAHSPAVTDPVGSGQRADTQSSFVADVSAGDIVWGKLAGSPWWPGKVVRVTCTGVSAADAQVSWYASSNSSVIACSLLQPFLDMFDERVNKRRRGQYREAVRLASLEARLPPLFSEASRDSSSSTAASPGSAVTSSDPGKAPSELTLAEAGSSPRPVDVAS